MDEFYYNNPSTPIPEVFSNWSIKSKTILFQNSGTSTDYIDVKWNSTTIVNNVNNPMLNIDTSTVIIKNFKFTGDCREPEASPAPQPIIKVTGGISSLDISDSILQSAVAGAIIDTTTSERSIITLSNTAFFNNGISKENPGSMGAIQVSKSDLYLSNNCIFKENQCYRGAAIQLLSDSLCFAKRCNFLQNGQNEMPISYGDDNGGGAIYCENSNMEIWDCNFQWNRHPNWGGAVWFTSGETGRSGLFVNCRFKDNLSWGLPPPTPPTKAVYQLTSGSGGAVAIGIKGEKVDVQFSRCKFIRNSAKNRGGAVFSGRQFVSGQVNDDHPQTPYFEDCYFGFNRVYNGLEWDRGGGAIGSFDSVPRFESGCNVFERRVFT